MNNIESSKKLQRSCSAWNSLPWAYLSLQTLWFWCWRPLRWRGPRTFENTELEASLNEDLFRTPKELLLALHAILQAIFKKLQAWEVISIRGALVPDDLKRETFSIPYSLVSICCCGKMEEFSSSSRDAWEDMDALRRSEQNQVMQFSNSCFYVVGSAEHSRCEGFSVYLVIAGQCYLPWAAERGWNHQWGTVSNSIDGMDRIPAQKAAKIGAEARHTDFTSWQRSASHCQAW